MFEAKPNNPVSSDVITPCNRGYSLFVFAPLPALKPAMDTLIAKVRDESLPILAWRWSRSSDVPQPLSFISIPPGERFLFLSQSRIVALDSSERQTWASFDQWIAQILNRWAAARHVAPPPSGLTPAQISPGQTAVLFRH